MAGDLNIFLDPDEKKKSVSGKYPLQETVESLIHAHDLLDFKPKSGRYTWSNNRVGATSISTRLDRFLIQSSLMKENNNFFQNYS